jgi:hypothetical protein
MAETQAQAVARRFHKDGTCFCDDGGTSLDDALRAAGAASPELRGAIQVVGGMCRAPFERWVLPDGSAVLITEAWWDLEGPRPWVCAGAEEDGELGSEDSAGVL